MVKTANVTSTEQINQSINRSINQSIKFINANLHVSLVPESLKLTNLFNILGAFEMLWKNFCTFRT